MTRPPRHIHDPKGWSPSPDSEVLEHSFAEVMQLLHTQRYTGKVTLTFRSGLPIRLIRSGTATLLKTK